MQAAKWSRLGNRATVMTSPMTVAAMTGPAPKTSVMLVPDALTAAASFTVLVTRIWPPTARAMTRAAMERVEV